MIAPAHLPWLVVCAVVVVAVTAIVYAQRWPAPGKRRVLIEFPGPVANHARVVIDGQDVTTLVRGVELNAWAGQLVEVRLTLVPDATTLAIETEPVIAPPPAAHLDT